MKGGGLGFEYGWAYGSSTKVPTGPFLSRTTRNRGYRMSLYRILATTAVVGTLYNAPAYAQNATSCTDQGEYLVRVIQEKQRPDVLRRDVEGYHLNIEGKKSSLTCVEGFVLNWVNKRNKNRRFTSQALCKNDYCNAIVIQRDLRK